MNYLASIVMYVVLGAVGLYIGARIVSAAYFKSKLDHYRDLGKRATPTPPPRTPLNGEKK